MDRGLTYDERLLMLRAKYFGPGLTNAQDKQD